MTEEESQKIQEFKDNLANGGTCLGLGFGITVVGDYSPDGMLGMLEAIENHPEATSLTFYRNASIDVDLANGIAAALTTNPHLKTLEFQNAEISDEALAIILKGAAAGGHIQALSIDKLRRGIEAASIDAKVATALSDWLEGDSSLKSLTISPISETLSIADIENGVGAIIIGGIANNNSLSGIKLEFEQEPYAHALTSMANAVKGKMELSQLEITYFQGVGVSSPHGITDLAALSDAILATNSPNMIACTPVNAKGRAFCDANKDALERLIVTLRDDGAHHLNFDERASLAIRDEALKSEIKWLIVNDNEKQAEILGFNDRMLTPPTAGTSLAALTTADDEGFAPLDKPATWMHLEEVAKALEAQGTPLTIDALQTPSPRDGIPFLENGIAAFADKAVPFLNSQGMHVRTNILFDDGKPTALLERCIENNQLRAIFSEENWAGASKEELNTVLDAICEEDRAKVTNEHALKASLGRSQPEPSQGRA